MNTAQQTASRLTRTEARWLLSLANDDRQWRSRLNTDWQNGPGTEISATIRNKIGPSGLLRLTKQALRTIAGE